MLTAPQNFHVAATSSTTARAASGPRDRNTKLRLRACLLAGKLGDVFYQSYHADHKSHLRVFVVFAAMIIHAHRTCQGHGFLIL